MWSLSSSPGSAPDRVLSLGSYLIKGSDFAVTKRLDKAQQHVDAMRRECKRNRLPVSAKPLYVPDYTRRFIPKTITPSQDIDTKAARIFADLEAILGPRAAKVLPKPRCFPSIPSISNEADYVAFLRERAGNDVLTVLETALERVEQLSSEPLLPECRTILSLPLTKVLLQIHSFNVAHESTSSCPVHVDPNLPHIFDILMQNDTLRKRLGVLPKRLLLDEVLPKTDLEILFRPHNSDEPQSRTCLVVETKSALDISFDDISQAFNLWMECSLSANFLESLKQDEIPLRRLLLLRGGKLSAQSKHVFASIVQLYHSMLSRRQTYGFLSWGIASISLQINWRHLTEPGQHVSYRLFSGDPWAACPPWQDSEHTPTPAYIMLCLSLLQLEEGLVQDDQVDRFVDDYYSQANSASSEDDDGNLNRDKDYQPPRHDDSSNASHDTEAPRKSRRISTKKSKQSTSGDATMTDTSLTASSGNTYKLDFDEIYSTLLSAASERQKPAVIGFFQPDTSKLCRLAKPEELVLYAAELLNRQLAELPIDRKDFHVLLARPLIWGPVPTELNHRIAVDDERG